MYKPAAQHAAAAHPATATAVAAGGTAGAGGSAPQAAQHSWRGVLAGPQQQHQQQAQGADVQQQDSTAAAGTSAAAAAGSAEAAAAPSASSSVCSGKADKLLGWTEGDLPQVCGAVVVWLWGITPHLSCGPQHTLQPRMLCYAGSQGGCRPPHTYVLQAVPLPQRLLTQGCCCCFTIAASPRLPLLLPCCCTPAPW